MGVFVCLLLVCIFLLLGHNPAESQLVINELYYDHPGTDDGYEFVELMNISEFPVALAGVAVEFHNGTGDAWESLWSGTDGTISPGELFAVGGRHVLPVPDVVEDLGLQNGPDALRVTVGGISVDVVGYGGLDDPAYVEGVGAPKVVAGRSLARIPDGRDSDDNAGDLSEAIPSPGLFNVARHDAAIRTASRTPAAAVLPDDGNEQVMLSIVNGGQHDISLGNVSFELWDSTETRVLLLERSASSAAIPPGASAAVNAAVTLAAGYHWLVARIDYTPDERKHNDELVLVRRVGGPALLVSEVLCYPGDGCPQFVELFNAGAHDIDVTGFMLKDKSHAPTLITEHQRVIRAGGYLAVTPDADALLQRFSTAERDDVVQHDGTWPTLNRSGSGNVSDSVVVTDRLALPIDAVAYPPLDSEYKGKSLERVDLYEGAQTATWVLSLDRLGATPGRAHARALLDPPQVGSLEVTPRAFSPYDGETLTIAVAAGAGATPADGNRVVVSVYDTRGRRLADIGSATAYPAVFVWNGTSVDGRILPPGLYLLVCESYSSDGAPVGVRKVVVGCGRRNR